MSLRRFDGSNFNFWKEQMQDYLIVKGQIDPIENENAQEIYKANEWLKLDRIVRTTIRMHLSESMYFTVQSCSIAFELWKTLSETYEMKVASTKMYLIRRLYNLRMKESNSVGYAHKIGDSRRRVWGCNQLWIIALCRPC